MKAVIEYLIINKNVNNFIFGSESQFNDLCYKIVSEIKEKYPQIYRIYVRAEFPYINDDYKNYLLKHYEYTFYPDEIIKAGKAVYIKRNYKMIDISDFCVIYYDNDYSLKKAYYKNSLMCHQSKSGVKLAYEYAERKGLWIKNVLDS